MSSTNYERLYEILKNAPKPQLHLHLDGSLSYEFIQRVFSKMKQQNIPEVENMFRGKEPQHWEDLRSFLMDMKVDPVVKPKGNWKKFDFCNRFLQTYENLCEATSDIVTRLYRDHFVNYIEIRFAPVLHTLQGMTKRDAVSAAAEGFRKAKQELRTFGVEIDGGIILCALRSYPPDQCRDLLEIIEAMDDVIGFDIAGDEKAYPLNIFKEILEECCIRNIKTTVHAGEWPECMNNIRVATEIGVQRIGHGLAIVEGNEEDIELLREKNIPIEINLTANCGSPLKCPSLSLHPLRSMLNSGLNPSALSCDNLLLSGNLAIGAPEPTKECVRALLDCGLTVDELQTVIANGYNAGFNSASRKIGNQSMKIWKNKIIPKLTRLL